MNVTVLASREGNHANLVLTGPFDLAHAAAVECEIENAEASLDGCSSVDIDLTQLNRIDGAGAVLLARLLDRLDADVRHASVVEGSNRQTARLIALYRERRSNRATFQQIRTPSALTRIGALTAQLPGKAYDALDFTGRFAVALPKAATAPSSVDWRSLPRIDSDGVGDPYGYEGVPPFGVLFQSGALFSSLTLEENLALPLITWISLRGAVVRELVQAKLDLVGLGPFAEHLPGEISGGMKKRAGIARALMLEPVLLFLDEPSAGLDPITAVELDELIIELNRNLGITIVVVTHELPSIFLVADCCIVLDKTTKGIVAQGEPRKLRDESEIPFVRNFFTRTSPGVSSTLGRLPK